MISEIVVHFLMGYIIRLHESSLTFSYKVLSYILNNNGYCGSG